MPRFSGGTAALGTLNLPQHAPEHPHHVAAEDFADAAAPVDSILAPVALGMGRTRD
jgi:hypothetical protein